MSERFFLAAAPAGDRTVLTGDEARHLSRVLRGQPGDEVVVFAGTGAEWPARIVRVARDEVELVLGAPRPDPSRSGPRLTLAVALPKGERQKWLVEKLTELGVDRLVPLVTTRGVAEATAAARARLERGVIEACKQCGRNTLMEIGEPRSVAEALAERPPGAAAIIAHPGGGPLHPAVVGNAEHVLALVGPEGGFTDAEVEAAERAGAVQASLGQHILRIETAAIALAARLAGCGDTQAPCQPAGD
jgi:16S rRNA (uracil1498-N3)-methyltransferase